MARTRRITVRGKQQSEIDPLVFLHVLLAIAEEQDAATRPVPSPDTFDAAVEDLAESPR
jgi:hypothetical protein